MAGRISARMALDEDYDNFILMHAMGSNTAGQLGSVIAGGLLLALVAGVTGIIQSALQRSHLRGRAVGVAIYFYLLKGPSRKY